MQTMIHSSVPALAIEDLSIAFREGAGCRPAVLDRVSFTVEPGRCCALVGESGSGKSLTAMAIMQLLPAHACWGLTSRIRLFGEELTELPSADMQRRRGSDVALVFQEAMQAFNPVRSVGDQVMEVYRVHGLYRGERRARAEALLQSVGIREPKRCMAAYPHECSGGMLQRAMIACAVAASPRVLIADEPTTALDVTLQRQILELFQSMQAEQAMTLLFISHDLAVVREVADDVVVMRAGHVVEQASAPTFFAGPCEPYSQQLCQASKVRRCKEAVPAATPLASWQRAGVTFKRGSASKVAVRGVDLQVPRGQTLALVGESGAGKTTLVRTLVGLQPLTEGRLQGWTPEGMPADRIKPRVQMLFQNPRDAFNPMHTVAEILAEALPDLDPEARSRRMEAMLARVQLPEDALSRYPSEFSGGQCQRLCLVRALLLEPEILVLDEPTSAVDVSTRARLLSLLDGVQRSYGLTYLLVTHDFQVVAALADWVAVMREGCVVEYGSAEQVMHDPQHPYTRALLEATLTL